MHPTGGSLRVFGHFAWLEAGSGKIALSRPAHQPVTHTVSPLLAIGNSIMRRFVFAVFVMVILSACSEANQNIQVLPSSTIVPSPTNTQIETPIITPSETQSISPTAVPSSLILAEFPLAMGTTWKYSAEISYQDPNDYLKLLTWVGTVTDKIIDKKVEPDGRIVFTVEEDLQPKPPEQVWRQSRTFEYTVSGDGVFQGSMKVYQYPLEDNPTWQAFSDFGYEVIAHHIGEVVTPYGKMDNCYTFLIATNPDTSIDTFCVGIGFVEHSYRHHGTPQDEEFVISSFTLGEP